MRKRIYKIIDVAKENDKLSFVYDVAMIAIIIMSLVPLVFKGVNEIIILMDVITGIIFIIDYIVRWITADYKLKKGKLSFLLYPFSPFAIIDLLSILPVFALINNGFKALRILRLLRAFRAFRTFKMLRYSKSFEIIANVLRKEKEPLLAVCSLAIGYILVSALIVFSTEPEAFKNFFDAVYWATISLTTVGYGDIYPITTMGRMIAMISSIIGIAIVALPSGIITAGYMNEVSKIKKEK